MSFESALSSASPKPAAEDRHLLSCCLLARVSALKLSIFQFSYVAGGLVLARRATDNEERRSQIEQYNELEPVANATFREYAMLGAFLALVRRIRPVNERQRTRGETTRVGWSPSKSSFYELHCLQ